MTPPEIDEVLEIYTKQYQEARRKMSYEEMEMLVFKLLNEIESLRESLRLVQNSGRISPWSLI